MSEKKKQEYTTGGLKNRQDVENALASAEYRPSQEVTDAASDLKQWQANRPGDYESAYQGRIDGLMEDLLDRKEFSYSYGADHCTASTPSCTPRMPRTPVPTRRRRPLP